MIGCSLILVLLAVLALAGCKTVRAGYESAPYKVVQSAGKFEVRDYPALMVVETAMAGGQGADGSFNRLFRYITGGNEAKEKIAMTTPVFMSANGSNSTMAFVMPAKLGTNQVPRPADGELTVKEIPPGRFAVLRFSGSRTGKNEVSAAEQLRAWIKTEGWAANSPPVYAYFDPPWTPTFLRRNEVMIRLDSTKP